MFRNNSFGKDSEGDFRERIRIMANGLSECYDSIGFSEAEVAEIEAFVGKYHNMGYQAKEERADEAEYSVLIRGTSLEVQKGVYDCRKALRGFAALEGGDARIYIEERFELGKKVPKRRAEYVAMAESILQGYTALATELPGFFVPPPPFERLQTALDKHRPVQEAISRERAEARARNSERRRLRKKGERILRNVFLRAVAHWGVDDSRLLTLGMVNKSGIWTPKKKSPAPAE